MKKLIFVFFLLLPLVAAGTVDISLEQVSSSNKVQIDVYLTPVDEPVEIESYDIFFESDDLESKIFTFIDGDTPNKDTLTVSIAPVPQRVILTKIDHQEIIRTKVLDRVTGETNLPFGSRCLLRIG